MSPCAVPEVNSGQSLLSASGLVRYEADKFQTSPATVVGEEVATANTQERTGQNRDMAHAAAQVQARGNRRVQRVRSNVATAPGKAKSQDLTPHAVTPHHGKSGAFPPSAFICFVMNFTLPMLDIALVFFQRFSIVLGIQYLVLHHMAFSCFW